MRYSYVLLLRAEARVESGVALLDLQHADRARQHGVQRAPQRRRRRGRSVTCALATCPAAWTPASVRPAAGDGHRRSLDARQRILDGALDRRSHGLPLPAEEVGAVVGQEQCDRSHELLSARLAAVAPCGRPAYDGGGVREPGFTISSPWRAERTRGRIPRGQVDREQGRERHVEARARRRCGRRAPRHPTTSAPAARATSIVSRVDSPVVTTSSTTTTRSRGARLEPAPQQEPAVLPFGENAPARRAPRATSWPMITPPSAGDSTAAGDRSRTRSASSSAERASRLRDPGGRARTAGSRCCAAPRTGGNARRAARLSGGRCARRESRSVSGMTCGPSGRRATARDAEARGAVSGSARSIQSGSLLETHVPRRSSTPHGFSEGKSDCALARPFCSLDGAGTHACSVSSGCASSPRRARCCCWPPRPPSRNPHSRLPAPPSVPPGQSPPAQLPSAQPAAPAADRAGASAVGGRSRRAGARAEPRACRWSGSTPSCRTWPSSRPARRGGPASRPA